MFAYSLSGLKVDALSTDVVEVEESELTARSAVYQVLGRLFSPPDDEHHKVSMDGGWTAEFEVAAELLAFDWEIGACPPGPDDADAHRADYERLFHAESNGGRRIWGGTHLPDREQRLVELSRAYEYYGLGASDADVAPDSLTAQLDYLQYLTFKEAAASSPRLGKSFRRAQLDMLNQHVAPWLPAFADAVRADDPAPLWAWATDRLVSFVNADLAWASS